MSYTVENPCREGDAMTLRRPVRSAWILLVLLVLTAAASVRAASAQARFEWPERAKNLKVLPKDTPREKLQPA